MPGAVRFLFLCTACIALAPLARSAAEETGASPGTADPIVSICSERTGAIVRVTIATEDLDSSGKPAVFVSSGFFINRQGQVLTTVDPTAKVTRIWIEKDGVESLAELKGVDPRTRIGLLQLVKLPGDFATVSIEAEAPTPPRGTPVLRLSQPLGFDAGPVSGIVAGYESQLAANRFACTYIRVTIPVSLGEEGAPVFDLQGRLLGMTVASIREIRSSYLVPSRALARIVEDLSTQGRVVYGSIPVDFDEFPDSANVSRQVVVTKVEPDSSAARAGLRAGDVVRLIGTSPVRRIHDVRDALFFSRVGQFIQLEVEREGRTIPYAIPVEPASAGTPPPSTPPPSDAGSLQVTG